MNTDDRASDRRAFLLRLAASGALGAAGFSGIVSKALARGDLPPGVNRLEGAITVNGRPGKEGTPVSPGDRVATGRASQAVIIISNDAFLMRPDTTIDFEGRGGALASIAVATGKVLSVFSKKPMVIKAATASIGIRGTGAYLEVEAGRVYFCLCYGEAQVDGPGMESKVVKTRHHESPLYLTDDGGFMRAEPGPVVNHTDEELIMLESFVGREPDFMNDGTYPSKRY